MACHESTSYMLQKSRFFVCYCEGQDHGGDDDVDGGGVAVVIPTLPFRSSHHHSRDPEDGQNQREH